MKLSTMPVTNHSTPAEKIALCAERRIVIEIDGAQHLGDAAVYRRDRRKDALLQSHGYLVLRFLADDLGRELETVLDAVLRVMAGRFAVPP